MKRNRWGNQTRRRPYRRSRRFFRSCRNHGTCAWCRDNRLYHARWTAMCAESAIREWSWEGHETP